MRILEVVGLTKRFAGLTMLDGVSFTVEEGEILGLFGPDGAGKTTCLHCLSGLAAPDGGRVIFDGREITGYKLRETARAGIACALSFAQPFPGLTAAENVMVPLGRRHFRGPVSLLKSWRGRVTRRHTLALLDQVGLGAEANRKAALLPLGMRKRLEIARALALRPRLLLLDEPLAGLSFEEIEETAGLVARLRLQGLTVILVEREMRVAMPLVDRVLVLHHGTLIASGPPGRIRSDPKVIEAYLAHSAR